VAETDEVPWRSVAAVFPEFVQWRVQKYGPIPDEEPNLSRADYDRLKAEYEAEAAAEAEAYDDSDWPG